MNPWVHLLELGVAGGGFGMPVVLGVSECLSDKYITFNLASWLQLSSLKVAEVWPCLLVLEEPWASQWWILSLWLDLLEPAKYVLRSSSCFLIVFCTVLTLALRSNVVRGCKVTASDCVCCWKCRLDSEPMQLSLAILFSDMALLFCLFLSLPFARCTTCCASSEQSAVVRKTVWVVVWSIHATLVSIAEGSRWYSGLYPQSNSLSIRLSLYSLSHSMHERELACALPHPKSSVGNETLSWCHSKSWVWAFY